jgi:transcriptional regulator with PAS, ATPase and Fis domain
MTIFTRNDVIKAVELQLSMQDLYRGSCEKRAEAINMISVNTPLVDIEKWAIHRVLIATENNKTRAAAILNISLRSLRNKLRNPTTVRLTDGLRR